MKRILAVAMLSLGAVATAPLTAQPDQQSEKSGNILDNLVNSSAPEALNVYNLTPKPKIFKDDDVKGGTALRIPVKEAGEHPWSATLASAVTKPIKKGDKIVIAFFGKAEKGDDGGDTIKLPLALQLAKDPYTPVFSGEVEVEPDWDIYQISGKADKDCAANELNVSGQLAGAAHTLDVGPFLILDMGQGQ